MTTAPSSPNILANLMRDYGAIALIIGAIGLVVSPYVVREIGRYTILISAILFLVGFDVIGWSRLAILLQKMERDIYHFLQNTINLSLVLALGLHYDLRVGLALGIVWLTFGLDIIYHWVNKAMLPDAGDGESRYFGYGYWSFPIGWGYALWYIGRERMPMRPWLVYAGALGGGIGMVWVLG